jgi:hypothetical protein
VAKSGIKLSELKSIIKDRNKLSGWALCVGAGTSTPLFPSWHTLVERLAEKDTSPADAATLTKNLAEHFGYDALIQAAQDRLAYNDKKFAGVLAKELYRTIRERLNKDEWKLFSRVLSSRRIGDIETQDWKAFLDIAGRYFSKISAFQLAEIVSKIVESDLAPSAILSFNAEPLLVSLINAFCAIKQSPSKKQGLDIITHSVSNRRANRIPFYFCHGLLPLPGRSLNKNAAQSIDKLVFSEASYLQLANLAFSWQSSVFIDVCSSKTVVFVGVSLSDPNMRRWLSWISSNRRLELIQQGKYTGVSTSHYWINKEPSLSTEKDWIESTVAHLGVRVIWIDSWDDVGKALKILLGMT